MSLFTRLSVAALLSGCFLFGGVPAIAEAPAGDAPTQIVKGDAKGKAKAGKKKGKKGKKKGKKKKGKKPSKAASA